MRQKWEMKNGTWKADPPSPSSFVETMDDERLRRTRGGRFIFEMCNLKSGIEDPNSYSDLL
jgi:hypothetical protein